MLIKTFKFIFLLLFFQVTFVAFAKEKDDFVIVTEFKIIGNKTTNKNIILREISFTAFDTLKVSNLTRSLERVKNDLLNTSLFSFVTVDPVYFDDEHISIFITVEERWYWWPVPIFEIQESNFNTWWLDKDFKKANYGLFLSKENFRGRKESLMFLFQGGYTERVAVKYENPYINKKQTRGLSLLLSYSRNKELSYRLSRNLRDYYRSNKYVQKEIKTSVGYEFRPMLYNKHNLELTYSDVSVFDSILKLNKDYLFNGENRMQYFSLNYSFKWDKRNVKNYPTIGTYIDFKVYKNGMGALSKLNSLYITSHLKKFWKIYKNIYFATSAKTKFTVKDSPYHLQTGFVFGNDLVRGYELYVINGDNYGLTKFQIRYSLLKNKVFNLSVIKFNKFNKIPLDIYLGGYFDAGYAHLKNKRNINSLSNTKLYGGGISLDFVSYYDLVLRMEYSINRLNERGLFLHFIAPI